MWNILAQGGLTCKTPLESYVVQVAVQLALVFSLKASTAGNANRPAIVDRHHIPLELP